MNSTLRAQGGKTWIVHISSKLPPEPKATKHEIWAGQFYSPGAYTIFHHTRAENTTFVFLWVESESSSFGQGMVK